MAVGVVAEFHVRQPRNGAELIEGGEPVVRERGEGAELGPRILCEDVPGLIHVRVPGLLELPPASHVAIHEVPSKARPSLCLLRTREHEELHLREALRPRGHVLDGVGVPVVKGHAEPAVARPARPHEELHQLVEFFLRHRHLGQERPLRGLAHAVEAERSAEVAERGGQHPAKHPAGCLTAHGREAVVESKGHLAGGECTGNPPSVRQNPVQGTLSLEL